MDVVPHNPAAEELVPLEAQQGANPEEQIPVDQQPPLDGNPEELNPGQQQQGGPPVPAAVPTPAEVAAPLVALYAAAIQATVQQQEIEGRTSAASLEDLILKSLREGDASAFLKQKHIFAMTPAALLEAICLKCGLRWQKPPLVGLMVHRHSRHVKLCLAPEYPHWTVSWTPEELNLLLVRIGKECADSLRSLEVEVWKVPTGLGVSLEQLLSLLQNLPGLETFSLKGDFQAWQVEQLLYTMSTSNPKIRNLTLPGLNPACFNIITTSWPGLESLDGGWRTEITSTELAGIIPKLTNLQELKIAPDAIKWEAMVIAARSHHPSDPPYLLTTEAYEGFRCSVLTSNDDGIQLFKAFPALHHLHVHRGLEIQFACAGLERSPDTRIDMITVEPPVPTASLQPLLALAGHRLKIIEFMEPWIEDDDNQNVNLDPIDINMINHYCHNLEKLEGCYRPIVAGDQFEPTNPYFPKLKHCDFLARVEDPPIQLPDPVLTSLLTNPLLERFVANMPISEEVAAAVCAESGAGRALSSLTELTLYHTNVSTRALAGIVSHAPRLGRFCALSDLGNEAACQEKINVMQAFKEQSGVKCQINYYH